MYTMCVYNGQVHHSRTAEGLQHTMRVHPNAADKPPHFTPTEPSAELACCTLLSHQQLKQATQQGKP
jgi:hypothetical protein